MPPFWTTSGYEAPARTCRPTARSSGSPNWQTMRRFPEMTPKFITQNILTVLRELDSSCDWTIKGPLHYRRPSERHSPAFIFKAKRPHQQTDLCVKIFVSFDGLLE